ncbi:glycine/betaine ABC transporter substrate-binding protein [Verrucomicrobia bacterium LW23]|nr:glycine/betaine ABC transporter substrate-binding protein [Verrucomicrobia bacterium LW23]
MKWDATQFWQTLQSDGPNIGPALSEHLLMTLVAVLVAAVVGFSLALFARERPRFRTALVSCCNTLQTVPSLALLALLLPLLGIGAAPAIAALILYALQPIVRSTLMAISECPSEMVDAGNSMGMTSRQILWHIQLPQGLPLLIAGLRTATVWSVGTATLGAFIMAGGLGEFINRGIALNNYPLVLFGAVPAAALAIGLDSLLAYAENVAQRWKNGFPVAIAGLPSAVAAIAVVAVLSFALVPSVMAMRTSSTTLRIGCKNFSEQRLLGELIAQRIEAKLPGVRVDRRFGFGSTQLLHAALERGDVDLYVEYTGTAEQTILQVPPDTAGGTGDGAGTPRLKQMERIRALYAERFNTLWLEPLGFNNSYTVICRAGSDAARYKTLSQLAPDSDRYNVAMNAEFIGRPDGYPAMQKRYGMKFRNETSMDIGFIYPALQNGQVDFAVAFYTDARLAGGDYSVVDDDLRVFPRYDACPVLRRDTDARLPGVRPLLATLAGSFSAEEMRKMNKAVEVDIRSPRDVAAEFWAGRP